MIGSPVEKALEYYNKLNQDAVASVTDSNQYILRVTLNYIRHNYSNYEQIIQQIGTKNYNKVELKHHVNKAIIKKYNFENLRAI